MPRSPEDLQMALIANSSIAEPAFGPPGLAVRNRLIAALRELQPPGHRPPTPAAAQAAIGAAFGVVIATLSAGEAERLPDFAPQVVRLILAPYIGDEEAKRKGRAAGFDGHLVKPVDEDALNAAIAMHGTGD